MNLIGHNSETMRATWPERCCSDSMFEPKSGFWSYSEWDVGLIVNMHGLENHFLSDKSQSLSLDWPAACTGARIYLRAWERLYKTLRLQFFMILEWVFSGHKGS